MADVYGFGKEIEAGFSPLISRRAQLICQVTAATRHISPLEKNY